jgi:FixJ family two-component response regulator
MSQTATVSIVDDDQQVRESLAALIQSMDLAAECYASGPEFLETYSPDTPGCVVLDLRMPHMSGTEVVDALRARRCQVPVVMISGHGDIPAAVSAMKSGAVDFLEKPFRGGALMESIHRAIKIDAHSRQAEAQRSGLRARFDQLTAQEKEVFELTAAGKPDKAIAQRLDVSLRTIQLRRASVMRKMEAKSRAELIRLAQAMEQTPA